jgi:8-amino-3,8-dideoxy-alpha-D-manno-octulosonate transaminase
MHSNPDPAMKLAIHGGEPARAAPYPPMYPGGNLLDEAEEQAVLEVIRSKRLFRYYGPQEGPSKVEELEQRFAALKGTRHALAVTSGTAALVCALRALGIGPGDEVILPAYTWIASASAVLAVGAVPVVAEVDESLTLDPADAARRITPRTRAILPVHMRGVPCQMDELLALARNHGLKVLEDAAQANGGMFHGRALGSLGDMGCYSLQFNKILTSGEGGMLVTDDEALWKRAVMFHDVVGGQRNHLPPEEILWGVNFRMPELLGAVMLVQLTRLEGLMASMRAQKQMVSQAIEPLARSKGIRLQDIPDPQGDASVAFVFFAKDSAQADRMAAALEAENVGAGVLYHPESVDYHIYTHWTPIVNHRTWSENGGPWLWAADVPDYSPAQCPRSLDLLGRAVHIDINPLLSSADTESTIEALSKVMTQLG